MGMEPCCDKDRDVAIEVALVVLFVVLAALAWAALGGVFTVAG